MKNVIYFTKVLDNNKFLVITVWILLTGISASLYTPNFIEKTTGEFQPPEGSAAYFAQELMEKYFPERVNEESHIIIIHNPTSNILTPELKEFTEQLVNKIKTESASKISDIGGYFVFDHTELDFFKYNFVSKNNHTSILVFNFQSSYKEQTDIAKQIRIYVSEINTYSFEVFTTGLHELEIDSEQQFEADLIFLDSIVLPLVFLLLILLLRNWKYFPITIIPIILTIILAFGCLERYITYTGAHIEAFVASILISLVLGVGVDYNLFLLSRFREERRKGQKVFDSVVIMMKHSGHTVFTSGITLAISIFGLSFFPISNLASIGISIAIAIFILLIINLSLTPCLLLLIGSWIEKTPKKPVHTEKNQSTQTFWYRLGKFSVNHNIVIVVAVLILTLPVAFQFIDATPKAQIEFFASNKTESGQGFLLMEESFGPGNMNPVDIILVPKDGNIWSATLFDSVHNFIDQSIQETILDTTSFASPHWLNNTPIPYAYSMALLTPESPLYSTTEGILYRQIISEFVNSDNNAVIITIHLPIDPYSPEAGELIKTLNNFADNEFSKADIKYGIYGITNILNSIIDVTFDYFPFLILIVLILIYLFVGLMFKAVFLPARLIATIALTIAFIYGANTVLFEYNTILNELFPILNEVQVTFFMVPLMTFSIIIGLGMDYDIFTIERIKEYTWNGLQIKEAIAAGINQTGGIITGAGLIMMIAFGGLIFSSSYILIQFGFILAFGVFLDTFVVRTFLVPAIMAFTDQYNWWPTEPPKFS